MTTTKPLEVYRNGNVRCAIYADGTTTRECEGEPCPEFPCSMDIKITSYCDSEAGCMAHCHEASNRNGEHAALDVHCMAGLPPGVEIAIGGGNPLAHPGLHDWLWQLDGRGLVSNLTVNQFHVERSPNLVRRLVRASLIHGVGVSYAPHLPRVETEWLAELTDNAVWHVIAGVHEVQDVCAMLRESPIKKVLILGYKMHGNGVLYEKAKQKSVWASVANWQLGLRDVFKAAKLVSFDNLALKQLGVRRMVPQDVWRESYMGDDGKFSMYVDLVRREYAVSSTSRRRLLTGTIREAFSTL